MSPTRFAIEGMNCGGCVKGVTRALEAVEGVEIVKVEVGHALVQVDEANRAAAVEAIEDAGFDVVAEA